MQVSCLFAFTLLLLSLLEPAQTDLIRIPISKRQRQSDNSTSHVRQLENLSGAISIENFQDRLYTGSIKLGSNAQAFTFVLDTGSPTLWVPGSPNATGSSGNYFNCSASSTCEASLSPNILIGYGGGAMTGYKVQDQIQIGDLTIPGFQMLSAQTYNGTEQTQFDGIIGLSRTGDPVLNFPTVLETMKQSNLIDVGMFSMYLGSDPNSNGSSTGELIFGGYDPQYAVSDFQNVSVKNTTNGVYWLSDVTAIGYGSDQNLSSQPLSVIFDSGGSLIKLSQSLFSNFMNAATAQGVTFIPNPRVGLYACNCSAQTILKNLTFYFEGATFSISPSQYIWNISGYCFVAISVRPGEISDTNPMVLGDAFLRNYYALYNADDLKVGLAEARPVLVPPSSQSSPSSLSSPSSPSIPGPSSGFPAWLLVIIVLILVIGIALMYRYNRRRKLMKENYAMDPLDFQDQNTQSIEF